MNFTRPVQFAEAVQSVRVRKLLPTSLTSDQLAQLPEQLREHAFFSARQTNAHFLQLAQTLIDQIISQGDVNTGATQAEPGQMMDRATARLKLKEFLQASGHMATGDKEDITDITSDARLNLIIDTQIAMNSGRGHYIKQQDPEHLDMWPAQELVRVGYRDNPRGEVEGADQFSAGSDIAFGGDEWPRRWHAAGGQFYDGRMIAKKNAPIWRAISDFGHPYPPFAFRSGIGVEDVSRDEAEDLGVIAVDEVIEPDPDAANMPYIPPGATLSP